MSDIKKELHDYEVHCFLSGQLHEAELAPNAKKSIEQLEQQVKELQANNYRLTGRVSNALTNLSKVDDLTIAMADSCWPLIGVAKLELELALSGTLEQLKTGDKDE